MKVYFALCFLGAILAGCAPISNKGSFATYGGDAFTPSEITVLAIGTNPIGEGIAILTIDGKSVGCHSFPRTCPAEVRMPPGKHAVELGFVSHNGQHTEAYLWFVGEPGVTYLAMHKRIPGAAIRLWIEDAASHRHVGGIVGSADEPM